jgi:hypothetical protein
MPPYNLFRLLFEMIQVKHGRPPEFSEGIALSASADAVAPLHVSSIIQSRRAARHIWACEKQHAAHPDASPFVWHNRSMADQAPDQTGDSFRLLSAAVTSGDADETARLLASFPALKSRLDEPMPDGSFGGTVLLRALSTHNRQLVDVLLSAGADINARSHWWAGSFGVLDQASGMESYLIEHGARVDAHAAARLGMLHRLRELVTADPSLVHARGGDGQTPLHFAASVEIAEFLLDQGAEIDARDIDHESTPAQYLVDSRQDVAR